jgi:hypothetical protein
VPHAKTHFKCNTPTYSPNNHAGGTRRDFSYTYDLYYTYGKQPARRIIECANYG